MASPRARRRARSGWIVMIVGLVPLAACMPEGMSTGAVATAPALGAAAGNSPATAHLTAFSAAASPSGFGAVCRRYAWACSTGASGGRISTAELVARADRINREVNRSVRPATDHGLYGRAEHWTLPERGAGDCEDYALLKLKRLLSAGVPADRLLLATAFNRRNEHHVVLILRTDGGDLVLDNLSDALRTWQQTGYTFVKMQNRADKRRWDAILLGPRASRA